MSAIPSAVAYTDDNPSVTGITISGGGASVCSITVSDPGGSPRSFEITAAGRMSRTAGSGTDELIGYVHKTAGSGSFSGGTSSTWSGTANGATTGFSLACIFTPTGSAPWTIDLSFVNGGGLATFAVNDVSLRVVDLVM